MTESPQPSSCAAGSSGGGTVSPIIGIARKCRSLLQSLAKLPPWSERLSHRVIWALLLSVSGLCQHQWDKEKMREQGSSWRCGGREGRMAGKPGRGERAQDWGF